MLRLHTTSTCCPPSPTAGCSEHVCTFTEDGGWEIERFLVGRGDVRGGGDRGEKSTYAPINGMVSGKYLWKNARTCSPLVIFSNSSKGMKSVQVNVLS